MAVLKFTPAEILKGKNYDAGWYGAKIIKASALTPASSGNSYNCVITFQLEGSEGKEVDYLVNSAGMGFQTALLAAVNNIKVIDLKPLDYELDTDKLIGFQLDVHLYIDNYNGRLQNKIDNFLPYKIGQNGGTF